MLIYAVMTLLFLAILALGFWGTAYEIARRCLKTVLMAREAGRPEIIEEVSRGIGHSPLGRTVRKIISRKLGSGWERCP